VIHALSPLTRSDRRFGAGSGRQPTNESWISGRSLATIPVVGLGMVFMAAPALVALFSMIPTSPPAWLNAVPAVPSHLMLTVVVVRIVLALAFATTAMRSADLDDN
jgi:hypothetical protein